MSRKGYRGVLMEVMPTKIRKRGCSSSSSSSSRVHNYRLNKRAILVGKNRAGLGIGPGIGLGRSRSSTPVPTWRTTPLRGVNESPKCGKSTRPVSARRLAATLWEMNGMPSPKISESNFDMIKRQHKKNGSKMQPGSGSGSGPLPRHLLDPPHSPNVSEKMDRSGTGSHRRRAPSISQRLMSNDQNVALIDSISNASFMEIETRSRPQTSSGSVGGSKSRLKDVSNALTTSKELLKIISRIWARADQPSSSMSLVSALHTELERARLQVNQLIQEQRLEKNDVNYLIKCFAEEKELWKTKEQQAVEAAVGSIAGELEVERKLRRRLESVNGKLGKELVEIKTSFVKVVKELESEKRAREITEKVCEELARNIDEVEKEREMLELADKMREERVQMKLSEAKHQFEEKNSAVSKLRKQLEAFLGTKRDKDEGEEGGNSKQDSGESDLHSIVLDLNGCNNADKGYKGASTSNSRRSVALQRSVSDGTKPSSDEMQRLKSVKDVKNQLLPSSRLASVRENRSPGRPLLERSKSRGEGQTNRRSKW